MGSVTLSYEFYDVKVDPYAVLQGSTAIPNPGYRFKEWGYYSYINGNVYQDYIGERVWNTLSTNPTLVPVDFSIGDNDYYAIFEPDPATQLKAARLFGEDRYETSSAVHTYLSQATDTSPVISTIVLASGEDSCYADGPLASVLAHIESASLMITPRDMLSDAAKTAILTPFVTKVILIGAEASISADVYQQIRLLKPGLFLYRISGQDRYKTAEAIYHTYSSDTWASSAILVSGTSFADSLSIASFAAKNHCLMLYTKREGLTKESQQILAQGNFTRLLVMGDTDAVSAQALIQAQTATGLTDNDTIRFAGTDRYETSQMVFVWTTTIDQDIQERLQVDKLALTRGDKHADALSATLLQAYSTSPVLLVRQILDASTQTLLATYAKDIYEIRFLGSGATLPEELIRKSIASLNASRGLTVIWAPDSSVAVV
jgi:putative cell wall-binding protein